MCARAGSTIPVVSDRRAPHPLGTVLRSARASDRARSTPSGCTRAGGGARARGPRQKSEGWRTFLQVNEQRPAVALIGAVRLRREHVAMHTHAQERMRVRLVHSGPSARRVRARPPVMSAGVLPAQTQHGLAVQRLVTRTERLRLRLLAVTQRVSRRGAQRKRGAQRCQNKLCRARCWPLHEACARGLAALSDAHRSGLADANGEPRARRPDAQCAHERPLPKSPLATSRGVKKGESPTSPCVRPAALANLAATHGVFSGFCWKPRRNRLQEEVI